MAKNLTCKQRAAYVKAAHRCPYCHSEELLPHSVQVDDGYAVQLITCEGCGRNWSDVYKLVEIYEED